MASYILVGSSSIVQVLSPTVTADVVAATIQTVPSGIVATTTVPQSEFDSGAASATLASFADAIEAVIASGFVSGGSGSSSLDGSGLQQYFVTFEVVYDPPGAPSGTVTADVDVPVSFLSGVGSVPGVARRRGAMDLIGATYNNLVALSGNQPTTAAPASTPTDTAV